MNIAESISGVVARAKFGAALVLLSGCTVLEPTAEPTQASDKQVVIHYTPAARGTTAEIGEYLAQLQGLSAEGLEQERQRLATQLTAPSAPFVRVRYGLLLGLRGASSHDLKEALSLLGDSSAEVAGERDLAGWIGYAQHLLEQQAAAAERGQKLSQDRSEAVRGTEALKRELSEHKAEIARLESQLNELKSIETSIIQREIEEGKNEP